MEQNSYARALGVLSLVLLGLGLASSLIRSFSGAADATPYDSPVFMLGAAAGILWIALKALLVQLGRIAVYNDLRDRDRV